MSTPQTKTKTPSEKNEIPFTPKYINIFESPLKVDSNPFFLVCKWTKEKKMSGHKRKEGKEKIEEEEKEKEMRSETNKKRQKNQTDSFDANLQVKKKGKIEVEKKKKEERRKKKKKEKKRKKKKKKTNKTKNSQYSQNQSPFEPHRHVFQHFDEVLSFSSVIFHFLTN